MPKEDYPNGDWDMYREGKCVCTYCGFDGKCSVLTWHQLLPDHVIPLKCKSSEREKSPLNVPENKVVCCYACNNAKKVWDKKHGEADFPGVTLRERVEKACKSAREFIQKYYSTLDGDFGPMTT